MFQTSASSAFQSELSLRFPSVFSATSVVNLLLAFVNVQTETGVSISVTTTPLIE